MDLEKNVNFRNQILDCWLEAMWKSYGHIWLHFLDR